jgi:WhiB family transcriptional regulator, redox-sensing transcriptional regulator
MIPRHRWQERASCRTADPELFYPAKGGSLAPAKELCNGCPVRAECLEYALAVGEEYGIWGGLTAEQRAGLREESSSEAGAAA